MNMGLQVIWGYLNFRIILCTENKYAPLYEYFTVSSEGKNILTQCCNYLWKKLLLGKNLLFLVDCFYAGKSFYCFLITYAN